MEESRRRFVAALTAGVTGALAGCGASESTTPTDDGTETDTPTPTTTETQTDTPTDDGTETDTPTEADQVVTVAPDGLNFSPTSFEIGTGDTVRWEWENGGHNVKADTTPDGSDWSGTPGSDLYSSGHTYSYTFETPGEYSYYCDPHRGSGMTGSFTVTQ
jgi:plastocyanin